MTDVPQEAERDALAARLHAAWERLAACELPAEQRSRLQRQLIAVCDAVKAPGAGAEACQRRLDGFLSTLNGIAKKSGYKS